MNLSFCLRCLISIKEQLWSMTALSLHFILFQGASKSIDKLFLKKYKYEKNIDYQLCKLSLFYKKICTKILEIKET